MSFNIFYGKKAPPNIFLVIIYALVFTCIVAIIGYNTVAMINYSKGLEIDILNVPPPCDYTNPKNLPSFQPDRRFKTNPKTIQIEGLNFSLSTTPIYFIEVCKSLCGGGIASNGQCNEVGNIYSYDKCIKLTEPKSNCIGQSAPIALVVGKTDIPLYAEKVVLP